MSSLVAKLQPKNEAVGVTHCVKDFTISHFNVHYTVTCKIQKCNLQERWSAADE